MSRKVQFQCRITEKAIGSIQFEMIWAVYILSSIKRACYQILSVWIKMETLYFNDRGRDFSCARISLSI